MAPSPSPGPAKLSHLNAAGEVHMVEVGERPASRREATAEGFIQMAPEVLALVPDTAEQHFVGKRRSQAPSTVPVHTHASRVAHGCSLALARSPGRPA